jgi:hypothetical protein
MFQPDLNKLMASSRGLGRSMTFCVRFIVKDAGVNLEDEAGPIAANITKLPQLLGVELAFEHSVQYDRAVGLFGRSTFSRW